MENNKVVTASNVYLFALNKLKKNFLSNQRIDDKLNLFVDQMYEAVEYYDIEMISKIYYESENFFIGLKDVIFYEEYYFIFTKIKMFYVNRVYLSKHEFEKIDMFYPLFPNKVKDILMDLQFFYADIVGRNKIGHVLHSDDFESSTFLPN